MGRKAREKLERRTRGGPEPPAPMRRRRRRKWIVGTLLALLIVGGGVGVWQWSGARTAPPEPAPRFHLLASTGRVITLDDFLGKQEVALIFYMGAG